MNILFSRLANVDHGYYVTGCSLFISLIAGISFISILASFINDLNKLRNSFYELLGVSREISIFDECKLYELYP